MIECFTDGSCRGNPGPGGWGAIVLKDGKPIFAKRDTSLMTTNNRMEMSAILWAVENCFGIEDQIPTIYSDSSYCVNTFTDWMWKWKANGWERSKGKPIENFDLVKKFDELVDDGFLAYIKKVPGHSGIKWNEIADRLATGTITPEEVMRIGG